MHHAPRRVSVGVGGGGAKVIRVSYGLAVLGDSTIVPHGMLGSTNYRVAPGKAQPDHRDLSIAHDMRRFIGHSAGKNRYRALALLGIIA